TKDLLPQKLYYLLQSPTGEIVCCKEYRLLDLRMGQNMFLSLVFEREPILCQAFASCEVLLAEPPFTILPNRYQEQEDPLLLARVMLDDWAFEEDLLLRQLSQRQSARLLFLQTQNLHDTLRSYLPYFTLGHVAQTAIGLAERLSHEHPDQICLLMMDQQILLIVMREGRLHLCNYYPWKAPLDIVYFVEAARDVCQLQAPEVPVFVFGELEVESEVAQAIWRYIPGLRFPTLLRSPQTGTQAYWKYAFLPQMSLPLSV
ncbi:MAG: DUF3822 family protein, partial [Bacteroidota bacterium]